MSRKEKTILLVEDDFLNRRLSKKTLIENGYIVLESKNSAEAIEILKNETIDLAILDINLGEEKQDGISLAQEIKKNYSIPFIYLTAYDTAEIITKAVASSPYSYLTKPFKSIDLIASIEIAIRQAYHQEKEKPSVLVKDGEYNVELPLDEIDYIESEGNYLLFHSGQKSYKCRSTIKQILEILPDIAFVQTHRAYVVNKKKIEKFNIKSLVVRDAVIPVSKNYADSIPFLENL